MEQLDTDTSATAQHAAMILQITRNVVIAANKARRQALLAETDWIAQRHVRQSAALTAAQLEARAKAGKAITTAQFKALENYAQALRDVPETVKAWPTMQAGDWPAKPDWLEAMLQKVAA